MSSDQPYTLHTDQVRGRYSDGAIHQGVEDAYMDEHLDAFDAWLQAVRRDAARAALDGLAREAAGVAEAASEHENLWVYRVTQGWAEEYRDTHYPIPEEAP